MKKLLGFGLLASLLAGCPVWSDNNGGQPVCTFNCPSGCSRPSDCAPNETCGGDGQCHSGDCSFWGCVPGFVCVEDPSSQTKSCEPGGTGTGGSSSSTGGSTSSTGGSTSSTGGSSSSTGGSSSSTGGSTSSTGGSGTGGSTSAPVYCGHPADCATGQICGSDGTCHPGPCSATNTCIYGYKCETDGTCQSPTAGACNSDADCSNGDVCIAGSDGKGGVCTPPANQCFDGSQCGPGENCVAGKCTLGCSTNADCRDGFTCNTTTGVCSGIAQACTVTNDCGNATQVCVGGACVPRSMGGACMNSGDVWTENGCIPNQAATFVCSTDGQLGSGSGVPGQTCAAGSICLHHDCWISCDAPNQSECVNQPTLDTCKPVTDGSMTYNVCGTATNLGNQCGAGANNMTCPSPQVCIDGFCK